MKKNQYTLADIMKFKEYVIAGYYGSSSSYHAISSNSINMLVLMWAFEWLKNDYHNEPYTFQAYKEVLLKKGWLSSSDECFFNYATSSKFNRDTNMVEIISEFPLNEQVLERMLKIFPQYSREFLENQEYIIPLDNYLQMLESMLEHYQNHIEYIVFYVDEFEKVHCISFYPTLEELDELFPSNLF